MEDIDFNWTNNDLSHQDSNSWVIVKCMRYVASKKKINGGGVVPENIPEEIKRRLENSTEWSCGNKTKLMPEKEKPSGKAEDTLTDKTDTDLIMASLKRELQQNKRELQLKTENEIQILTENAKMKQENAKMKQVIEILKLQPEDSKEEFEAKTNPDNLKMKIKKKKD